MPERRRCDERCCDVRHDVVLVATWSYCGTESRTNRPMYACCCCGKRHPRRTACGKPIMPIDELRTFSCSCPSPTWVRLTCPWTLTFAYERSGQRPPRTGAGALRGGGLPDVHAFDSRRASIVDRAPARRRRATGMSVRLGPRLDGWSGNLRRRRRTRRESNAYDDGARGARTPRRWPRTSPAEAPEGDMRGSTTWQTPTHLTVSPRRLR